MRIHILTIFPDMFNGPFQYSIVQRAVNAGIIDIKIHDIRKYASDKHNSVDDYQFGGGPGMVMMPQPIFDNVEGILAELTQLELASTRVILTSPQGKLLNQKTVKLFSKQSNIVIICGHYEGVDERVREHLITDDVSIGDYVLTGGEIAAMVLTDAMTRLIPGVVGTEASIEGDSITSGLLQHPIFTRSNTFRDWNVPEVLLSGNHGKIEQWRRRQSLDRTLRNRPDLLVEANLTEDDRAYLRSLGYRDANYS
jgi:tRNA (guanine37-N1)-methyltransferase